MMSRLLLVVLVTGFLVGCGSSEPRVRGEGGTGGSGGNADGGTGGGGEGGLGDGGTGGLADGGTGGGTGGFGGDGGTGGTGTGGSGGTGGTGGTGGGNPLAIVVEGWVSSHGRPYPDALVVLDQDPDKTVRAGNGGRFRFTDVVPPYDIAVVVPGWDDDRVLVGYHGLTHENPRLVVEPGFREADLSGVVTGVPQFSSSEGELYLGLSGVDESRAISVHDTDVELQWVTWQGEETYSGTLVGVYVETPEEGGFEFATAGASAPFEVRNGGAAHIDVSLDTPVETQTTQIVIDAGAYSEDMYLDLASFEVFGAVFPGIFLPPIVQSEVRLPSSGASVRLIGRDASGNTAVAVAPAQFGSETHLVLPDEIPLLPLAPKRGATGASLTPTLEWTAVPGAKAYAVTLEGEGVDAKWHVPAGTTKLEVPPLQQHGFRLVPNSEYRWSVQVYFPAGYSPQELTDPNGPGRLPTWWLHVTLGFHTEAQFTTAPTLP